MCGMELPVCSKQAPQQPVANMHDTQLRCSRLCAYHIYISYQSILDPNGRRAANTTATAAVSHQNELVVAGALFFSPESSPFAATASDMVGRSREAGAGREAVGGAGDQHAVSDSGYSSSSSGTAAVLQLHPIGGPGGAPGYPGIASTSHTDEIHSSSSSRQKSNPNAQSQSVARSCRSAEYRRPGSRRWLGSLSHRSFLFSGESIPPHIHVTFVVANVWISELGLL